MRLTKRLLSIFMIFCMLLFVMPMTTFAINFSDGYFEYTIDYTTNTATVVDCEDKTATEIVIPTDYNGKPVVAIGANAFLNNTYITTVTFAEGSQLETVENNAFNSCSALKTVVLPAALKNIDNNAFMYCTALETVEIQSSGVSAGVEAFYNCSNLKNIDISKFSYLGKKCFYKSGIETAVINSDVFTNAETSEVSTYMFAYCNNLTKVIIRDAVADIPIYTFACCENLSQVLITGAATTVNTNAFYKASSNLKIYSNLDSKADQFADANGYTNFIFGDMDGSDTVNVRDATALQMHSAFIRFIKEDYLPASDLNFDGNINIRDLSLLQRYVAFMISEF